MFSLDEKKRIAEAVEKALLEIDHPEMPKERPRFALHVYGMEGWSWADIVPNWTFENNKPSSTEWNENAREHMKDKKYGSKE